MRTPAAHRLVSATGALPVCSITVRGTSPTRSGEETVPRTGAGFVDGVRTDEEATYPSGSFGSRPSTAEVGADRPPRPLPYACRSYPHAGRPKVPHFWRVGESKDPDLSLVPAGEPSLPQGRRELGRSVGAKDALSFVRGWRIVFRLEQPSTSLSPRSGEDRRGVRCGSTRSRSCFSE
jgi:hypothetical protein